VALKHAGTEEHFDVRLQRPAYWLSLALRLRWPLGALSRRRENLPARKDGRPYRPVHSLFRDTPERDGASDHGALQPLMESQTGIKGQLVMAVTPWTAQRLKEDKLQLGVFHGVGIRLGAGRIPELRAAHARRQQTTGLHAYCCPRDSDAAGSRLAARSLAVRPQPRALPPVFCTCCCRRARQDSKR